MHSLLIIGSFPDEPSFIRGGVQASVYGLAKTLKARNDIGSIEIISLPHAASVRSHIRSASVEGMNISYLQSYKFLVCGLVHLPFILKKIHEDTSRIVHIHGTGLLQCVLLAILRSSDMNSCWTLHGITKKETRQRYLYDRKITSLLRHWFYSIVERICIKTAQKIIVDTPYVKEEIRHGDNIHVIPQGIFSEEFNRTQNPSSENPLVLSVGVLNPRKGHHHTLEAYAAVRKIFPNTRLVIAGALQNHAYFNRLQEHSARLGLSDEVQFLINPPRKKLMDLFSEAYLFALHSEEESQGIALCEALAAGVPVVATRSGGIPYVVTHRKDGYLVEYGNAAGFADYITALLMDEALRKEFSGNARISSKKYDWKNISGEVMNVYLS